MRVACGFDHAGVPLREAVLSTLREAGHEPMDLGTDAVEPVDYPDVARAVSAKVLLRRGDRGVLICGSGAGVAVAATKIGARVIGPALAGDILRAFVAASFSGEERHRRRLAKVLEIERSQARVVERTN